MIVKYSNLPDPTSKLVYIRAIAVADLPEEVQEQAQGIEVLYGVHRNTGERLALVSDRKMAFALAQQHDMVPVNVH